MRVFVLFVVCISVFVSSASGEQSKNDRINAAKNLTNRLDNSIVRNFQIQVYAKGKNCDIMHVETLNLLPSMMEALATGSLIYGQAIPGGVNNYANNNGFKGILYTSRADNSFISYGENKISRSAILKMSACASPSDRKANETSKQGSSNALANKGKLLIRKIHKQYNIHSFYSEPNRQGATMVIWLPEKAWKKLSNEQQASIKAYMKSRYPNSGIGIGRVNGVDITSDEIIPIQ